MHIASLFLLTYEGEGEVAQSCPTLCDPVDCNLLGFSVHGILQARILEWVAISFSMLDHTVVLFLIFSGASILFSIVAVLVCIPTNSVRGFPFLHTLSSIYCL